MRKYRTRSLASSWPTLATLHPSHLINFWIRKYGKVLFSSLSVDLRKSVFFHNLLSSTIVEVFWCEFCKRNRCSIFNYIFLYSAKFCIHKKGTKLIFIKLFTCSNITYILDFPACFRLLLIIAYKTLSLIWISHESESDTLHLSPTFFQ